MVYTKIILDTRRKKTSEIYTVKIRVTANQMQKYYLTGYKMTESDFGDTFKNVPPKRFQNVRIQLDHLEVKAKTIISDLGAFSFRGFEAKLYEKEQGTQSVYDKYSAIIEEKMAIGKISTAINYRCSMKSLQSFSRKLSYVDITPRFLKEYEKFLLDNGKSISTAGIYLRPLRAIINEAIENKAMSRDNYPFGIRKYVIPESRNTKKALSREDLKLIIRYVPEKADSFEARSRDFWLLSYLCQGMNPKDLLLLKTSDMSEDFIKFIRSKTKDTVRRNPIEIRVPLLPETRQIIERWRNKSEESPFLFPFVNQNQAPLDVYKTVQQFIKVTNKHMNIIGAKLGIIKNITCYVARFQFTKTMIDADVSVEFIRQCLGHTNTSTTVRYIGSFEDGKKHEIAKKYLLCFQ